MEKRLKINKLQKRILIVLLVLCMLTPVGVLLPAVFDTGNAWGEWSAQTMKDMIGYVPEGLAKYSNEWNAPIPDYTVDSKDTSLVHQSGYYLVSGIIGATVTYGVLLFISTLIVKNE
jgi:cobalt/nickel transport protein